MKILLLGSGGREHALAWKMKKSKHCSQLFIAPGNAGTDACGINVNLAITDFEAINTFCLQKKIDMMVVGPEEPLAKGITDYFTIAEPKESRWSGIVIGPSAAGAQLESSKDFSKAFMQRYNIPTAAYATFDASNFEAGKKYIAAHSLPVVLKADGLAAGKGVVIASTHEEALSVFEEMIIHKQFGDASARVVIEEFLSGIELSVFVLTDGKDYKIIGHAKDYKRIGEGETGLNTGGMGCVSPVPFADDLFMKKVEKKIIQPTISGISKENMNYKGFVFFGLINVGGEPYVIEYNCRLGDPETEVILPRLKNDIVELFLATENGTLQNEMIQFDKRSCATVMAVSGGYPGEYQKGIPIRFDVNNLHGLFDSSLRNEQSGFIFHAGTLQTDRGVVTNGGRVLAVSAFGTNIADAVHESKKILHTIHFANMYYRQDIGFEFM